MQGELIPDQDRSLQRWSRSEVLRVVGGFVLGAAFIAPELTGLIAPQSLSGHLMELGALASFGQATFPLQRHADAGFRDN